MDAIIQVDNAILDFLQSIHNSILNAFFGFYTTLGDSGLIWIVLSFLLLIFPKTRKAGLCSLFAMAFAYLFGEVFLKNLICRPRPFYQEGAVYESIIKLPSGYSFPSGHSASSFAAAASISLVIRKKHITIMLIIAASLMAFSRIYLYVHYPTDILAGALLGIILAFGTVIITQKIIEGKSKNN